MNFCPRTEIKGQALAGFIAEFTYASAAEVARMKNGAEVAKVIEARDKEDLHPQKMRHNGRPSM